MHVFTQAAQKKEARKRNMHSKGMHACEERYLSLKMLA